MGTVGESISLLCSKCSQWFTVLGLAPGKISSLSLFKQNVRLVLGVILRTVEVSIFHFQEASSYGVQTSVSS